MIPSDSHPADVGWTAAGSSQPPTKPASTLRAPEPYVPFPTAALPEPLRSFVVEGAAALRCDESYLALPALVVVASLVGNSLAVRLKRDWTEPCVAWGAIVGDSGTMKSPAMHLVVGPLYALQQELQSEFHRKLAAFRDEAAKYLDAKAAAKKNGGRAPEPPEQPTLERVILSDVTVEKLAAVLEENPRGVLVFRDELSGWLASFSRYKSAGDSDRPMWLEAFRAGAWIVDRKTGDRPSTFVPNAAVSVVGGVQPVILARHMDADNLGSGLFARVLLCMPPKKAKCWTEDEVRPETRAAYEKLLGDLRSLELDRDDGGRAAPFAVRLSPEARAEWVRFYNSWAAEQNAAEGEVAAALSKLEGYGARFALSHHAAKKLHAGQDVCDPIEVDSVLAAEVLVRWFGAEGRRIYGALAESAEQRDARRLIEFVRGRGGRSTVKAVLDSNRVKFPTAEDAEGALQRLVDAGLAFWEERPAGPKGGRPTRDCVLVENAKRETGETLVEGDEAGSAGDGGGPPRNPRETPAAGRAPLENGRGNGVSPVSPVLREESEGLESGCPGDDLEPEGPEPREGVSRDAPGVSRKKRRRNAGPQGEA